MTIYAELTFWTCLLFIAYTYLFYPLVLFQVYTVFQIWRDVRYLSRRRSTRARELTEEQLPGVSLIIPAYNEEAALPLRIRNLNAIDYPPEKLEVVFVSDGSTDSTHSILSGLHGLDHQVIVLPGRGGKSNAMNHGVKRSRFEILLFSDAATLFEGDTIRKIVRHFCDPRVGAVCGTLQFEANGVSRQTEGVYWKYESMLRLMESRLGVTLTASGALYAVRRECFHPLDPETMIEDFVVPMNCRKAGYQVVYDPEAIATDVSASTVKGEFTRRVRLAVGSFRAFRELSRVPLDSLTCIAFFSHKILRWFLPFFLLGLIASNLLLLGQEPYTFALACQAAFYFAALMGLTFQGKNPFAKVATLCYYLLAIHLAYAVGLIRMLSGKDQGVWQKSQ
jgi:cellulose synthase/poly-beta-1,6-N-acetylglucosamine synthase-like glycosyltransferase